jgi:hypothetical protein
MLFARFLAECGVLIEANSGVPISMEECKELAREQGTDWLSLACAFAQQMLPQIFRTDDSVLEISLPAEHRHALEELLTRLPADVFVADDSLGWVYQFWQTERKNQVNDSGVKIGVDELPAVTQLFTEDYMVLFLLENTLGAWWAGKHLNDHQELALDADDEEAVREGCRLPGYRWTYLRFVRDDGRWRPLAGTFEKWPRAAKDLRVLDPCMGSGHFLVFALLILIAMRRAEEDLTEESAVESVLQDNLFGLEIDLRCTQIAAFNLGLAAWRRIGFRPLPPLNLACSGLAINAKEADWVNLAGQNEHYRQGMEALYRLFRDGPTLGTLTDPNAFGGSLLAAGFRDLQPLLHEALAHEAPDDTFHELAVTAQGVAKAAELLSRRFTLVVTNVPYLGREKQADTLREHLADRYEIAKADLAYAMVLRVMNLADEHRTCAMVLPQYWLFLSRYKRFRSHLLATHSFRILGKLGPGAFETITGEVVNTCLTVLDTTPPDTQNCFSVLDAVAAPDVERKKRALRESLAVVHRQNDQQRNPDSIIGYASGDNEELLLQYAYCYQGLATSDNAQFIRAFWEMPAINNGWVPFQMAPSRITAVDGCSWILHWDGGRGKYWAHAQALKEAGRLGGWKSGHEAWGQRGVAVNRMGQLPVALYTGAMFDCNVAVIIPRDREDFAWIWAYASASDYSREVRRLNQKPSVTNLTLVKVPSRRQLWQQQAAAVSTAIETDSPTQWLFNGSPAGSQAPLQVAVARLLGYRWPLQTESGCLDFPLQSADELETHTDHDGIVCLPSLRGEPPAADRLRGLLAQAFGRDWSPALLNKLLSASGYGNSTLNEWLRDAFFDEHCSLFNQQPFIWHIWDGLRDGFAALVNYHRLAGPNGEARRTLEKLIYAYLGDWIDRQRADQSNGVQGADARVAAAQHLKGQLAKVLQGEPPYDLFVRWKPLRDQPLGWEPDLNDGVRVNIRPFMAARPLTAKGRNACILRVTPKINWDKDRGKEPHRERDEFPWFWSWDEETQDFSGGPTFDGNRWNDLHYSRDAKHAARQTKVNA